MSKLDDQLETFIHDVRDYLSWDFEADRLAANKAVANTRADAAARIRAVGEREHAAARIRNAARDLAAELTPEGLDASAVLDVAACLDGCGGADALRECWRGHRVALERLALQAREKAPKRGQRQRGRKPTTDPAEDAKIANAWNTGRYRTYVELAREIDVDAESVRRAIDRDRHRRARKAHS